MLKPRTGPARQPLPALSLDDPELYESQIHRMAERRARDRWLVPVDAISGALDGHARDIARRLARDIPRDGYQFAPLVPHHAVLHGKPRIIYRVDALDAVVWGAYARALSRAIEPRLGHHLFSYRAGLSQFRAADACLRYFRRHVAQRTDPRQRGLCVLRRDVRRYDETIAVGDDSSLWQTLDGLSKGTPLGEGPVAARLMRAAFRPPIVQDDGSAVPLSRGMPTGIPTQTIACNVYLLPVDRQMLAIEGGFYARFGDDILFAHPDIDTARRAAETFERATQALGLSLNPDKSLDYWLTGVGRARADAPDFRPARKLAYLGFDVGLDGTRLRTDKRRQFLRELRERLEHAHGSVADCSFEVRATTCARVVQAVLDPRHTLRHRYASWLLANSVTRRDLLELDHLVALHCAECLTGVRGIRAFRGAPRRLLYETHQLPSLVQLWEQARHPQRKPS